MIFSKFAVAIIAVVASASMVVSQDDSSTSLVDTLMNNILSDTLSQEAPAVGLPAPAPAPPVPVPTTSCTKSSTVMPLPTDPPKPKTTCTDSKVLPTTAPAPPNRYPPIVKPTEPVPNLPAPTSATKPQSYGAASYGSGSSSGSTGTNYGSGSNSGSKSGSGSTGNVYAKDGTAKSAKAEALPEGNLPDTATLTDAELTAVLNQNSFKPIISGSERNLGLSVVVPFVALAALL